jgi:hypothetical protein
MTDITESRVAALINGARAVAEKLLKDLSDIAPFGLTLDAGGSISEVVFIGGDTGVQALAGGSDALLQRETLLNAEMRRRAGNPEVVGFAMVTKRDTADGNILCVQSEIGDTVVPLAIQYQKKFLGWSFGKMGGLDSLVYTLPQDGKAPAPPDAGPFQNAFAPSSSGDALYHRKSGFRFPAQLGEFGMCNPWQYDAHGHDVSHGYQHTIMKELAVTTYVYPNSAGTGTAALAAHFAHCRKDLENAHSGVKPLFEDEVRLDIGDAQRTGRQGVFRLKTEVPGTAMDSLSEVWLFAHEGFFIKYRATYPPELKTRAPGAVRELVGALAWP